MSSLARVNPETMPSAPPHVRFSHRSTIVKAGVDVALHLRYTSDSIRKIPILIIPGLLAINGAYDQFADMLAQTTDRPVATVKHARRERRLGFVSVDKCLHPAKIGSQAVVASIDELRKLTGTPKVTLFGHSKGGPDAVDGALRRPELVDNIVLAASAGLEKGQNTGRLAKRMGTIIKEEIIPGAGKLAEKGNLLETGIQVIAHLASNPWRAAGEVLDVSNRSLMADELTALAEAEVWNDALFFEDDHFFPAGIAMRDSQPLVHTATLMPNANHYAPFNQPERTAQYAGVVLLAQQQRSFVA